MGAIIIADLHVSKHRAKNQLIEERLLQLKADHPDDILIVLGDVTDDGHCEQFAAAERLLSPWRGRLLLCPGNHSFGPLGLTWDPECVKRWIALCQRLDAKTEAILPSQSGRAWRVCCLDSTKATPGPWDLARGELGGAELERAKHAIERSSREGTRVCIALHHDPTNDDPTLLLEDAEQLISLCWGKVDVLAFGHTHKRAEWTAQGDRMSYIRSMGDFRGTGDYYEL
jgi:predicted phosphodiesterase